MQIDGPADLRYVRIFLNEGIVERGSTARKSLCDLNE